MARRRWSSVTLLSVVVLLTLVLVSPEAAWAKGERSRPTSEPGLLARLGHGLAELVSLVANLGPELDPAGTPQAIPAGAPAPATNLGPELDPAGAPRS